MPDDACRAVKAALSHQLSRLNELIQLLNDGHAWPSDPLALADAEFITQHAKAIEASVDEIARVVSLIKRPPPSADQ